MVLWAGMENGGALYVGSQIPARPTGMFDRLAHALLSMVVQTKLYRWQTTSHARHQAADELAGKLAGLADRFVEAYAGKYGRGRVAGDAATLRLANLNDVDVVATLHAYSAYLTTDLPKQLQPADTDLFAIRDEMLAAIHRALFLFGLR